MARYARNVLSDLHKLTSCSHMLLNSTSAIPSFPTKLLMILSLLCRNTKDQTCKRTAICPSTITSHTWSGT